jgi:3'-5' exoribonuclease
MYQKTSFIKDLAENVSIDDVFALEGMELLPFREKPGMFLKMRLADRTGEISAFVWDNAEDVRKQIAHADFVKVSGIARIYRDKFSINVTIASCMDGGMVDPNDFLPCTPKDRQSLLEELQSHVDKINNHHLRNLLGVFFDDTEWVREFSNAPAAKRMHQPYLGGLLEHTVNMLNLVPAVCSNYHQIDRDLLTTGVILHDIGKIEEYEYASRIAISYEGHFLGHIILGIEIVARAIDSLESFPDELRLRLLHMIASHHGRHEWQSPEVPKTIEAMLLHQLDLLDAEAYKIVAATGDRDDRGWSWSGSLERWVYTPGAEASDGSDDTELNKLWVGKPPF